MLLLVAPSNERSEAVYSLSRGYVVPASAPAPSGQIFIRLYVSERRERSRLNISKYAPR